MIRTMPTIEEYLALQAKAHTAALICCDLLSCDMVDDAREQATLARELDRQATELLARVDTEARDA